MTQLTDKVFAYPIPDEAIQVTVYQFKHSRRSIPYWHINWNYPKGHQYSSSGACFFYKMLGGKNKYPTSLRFLFTTKEATEGDAREVVKRRTDLKDNPYMGYEPGKLTVCWNALQSLASLLRSKGLDDKNNYALIEKDGV